ncbi:MAG: phosphodiester glycosidase family protein [Bacteroidetes bacterium]|nr:phosphodiester glycosidase family protein [Bacteroidota bacterium]
MIKVRLTSLLLIACMLPFGCGSERATSSVTVLDIRWENRTMEFDLPAAISILEGTDEELPLKTWMARIDLSSPEIDISVTAADDEDGRMSVGALANESDACLAINGGFYLENDDSFEPVGLLISKGRFLQFATPGIYWDDKRYDVNRSAIGFYDDNRAEIGWVSSRADSVHLWPTPVPNEPGKPGSLPDSISSIPWMVTDAVSGGPALLKNGSTSVTSYQEAFFGPAGTEYHPRTAAGITKDGDLLLLVIDGRQRASRGVSFSELAGILKSLGAVEALNLDGGGSSTLVVNGTLLNRPAGASFQREVVSALTVRCQ